MEVLKVLILCALTVWLCGYLYKCYFSFLFNFLLRNLLHTHVYIFLFNCSPLFNCFFAPKLLLIGTCARDTNKVVNILMIFIFLLFIVAVNLSCRKGRTLLTNT